MAKKKKRWMDGTQRQTDSWWADHLHWDRDDDSELEAWGDGFFGHPMKAKVKT